MILHRFLKSSNVRAIFISCNAEIHSMLELLVELLPREIHTFRTRKSQRIDPAYRIRRIRIGG